MRSQQWPYNPSPKDTIREEMRLRLSCHPAMYMPQIHLRDKHGSRVCQPSTDLMIEGFPRSGNTYLTSIVELYNPKLKVAHHVHAVAHIIQALRYGVPVALLIREPLDAVSSLWQYMPDVSARTHLRHYVRFHSKLMTRKDYLHVIRFSDLIARPRLTVAHMAATLGLVLADYPGDDVAEASVRAEIDRRGMRVDSASQYEYKVARPSQARSKQKSDLNEHLAERYPNAFDRARELHSILSAAARPLPEAPTRS